MEIKVKNKLNMKNIPAQCVKTEFLEPTSEGREPISEYGVQAYTLAFVKLHFEQ